MADAPCALARTDERGLVRRTAAVPLVHPSPLRMDTVTKVVISLESSAGVTSLGSSVITPVDCGCPGRDQSNVDSKMKLGLIEQSFQRIRYDALAKVGRNTTGNEGATSVLGKRGRFIPCGSRSDGSSFRVSMAKGRVELLYPERHTIVRRNPR